MKRLILVIFGVIAALSGYAQTSNQPSSLGEIKLFRNAKAPFTIVLEPNYPKDTVIVELWDNGVKLSDTTPVTVSGDTIKFTIPKSQVKDFVRDSYFYIRLSADSTIAPEFGAKLMPSFGIGVPNIASRTIAAPSKGIVRVSLIGDASIAIQAADKAVKYKDSTQVLFSAGQGLVTTRKKIGKNTDLINNPESVNFFEIAQKDSVGTFIYDPSDVLSPTDSVLVIRSGPGGARRYKRQFTGPANVKWWGAKGDSSTNDTQAINRALNNPRVKEIFFPRGVYRISLLTLGKGNKTITFEAGTIIEGTGALGTYGYMLTLKSTSNIIINGNGVLFRDKQSAYSPSQFRGAVKIMSCTNVTINDVLVNDTPGDGFYIGSQNYGVPNINITLNRCKVDDVWRNGFSIINVIRMRMQDCSAVNIDATTVGTAPRTGLYMEPNDNVENLEDIIVNNFYSASNGGGISIVPVGMDGTGKKVSITINNPHDFSSGYGMAFGASNGVLEGKIEVNNPLWDNTYNQSLLVTDWHYQSPRIEINNPVVLNPRTNGTPYAAFLVIKEAGGGNYPIGNVHIINPIVRKLTAGVFTGHIFYFDDQRASIDTIQNCSVIDPVELYNIDPGKLIYHNHASISISDKFDVLSRKLTANTTVGSSNYARKYTNEGATGAITLTLPAFLATAVPIRFTYEVKEPFMVTVTPSSSIVVPYTTVAGQSIKSEVVGSSITLERVSATVWKVIEMKGIWLSATGSIFSALPVESGVVDSNQDFTTRYNKAIYFFYSTSANRTVILPPPSLSKGVPYYFKKVANNAFTVTITASDGSTIENASSLVLSTFMQGYLIMSDGAKYWIVD